MTREISEKIKVLGFLMTCAVVFYHCPPVDESYIRGSLDAASYALTSHIWGMLGTFAMSHFFLVTGYLLFQNFSLANYPEKIRRRVSSLLVPYVLWQCATVALKLILNGEAVPIGDFLRKTFLFIPFPYNGALWYVYAVFFLALLSPVLLPLFRRPGTGWACVLILTVLAEAREQISNPVFSAVVHYGYFGNILTYLPAYLTGCFYGKFGKELEGKQPLKYILSALFLAMLLDGAIPGIFSGLTVKLMPMMVLYLLPAVPGLAQKPVLKLSFLVYALHQPLIGILGAIARRVYPLVPLGATVWSLLTLGTVLITAICLAAVIHRVLKRLCPPLLRGLTGGRF